jgi:hypothetical protein
MVAFRHYNVSVVALLVVVLSGTGGAYGFVIDGQLSDWGVTPFAHWAPNAGIAYVADNWGDNPGQHGSYPYGGEAFDLEAAYTAQDATHLYIAIVSSMPEAGVDDPHGRPYHILPGDVAISTDGGASYAIGIVGAGPDMGKAYLNPTWSLPAGAIGLPQNGPSTLSGGTLIAQGIGMYADAGVLESDGSHTYVLEMSIPVNWSSIPISPGQGTLQLHYTMTCGNDALNWTFTPSTPEPSVIALLASSVGTGLLGRRVNRRITGN